MKKIYVENSKEIGYFIVNKKGRVLDTEKEYEETWKGTYLYMPSVEVGKRPRLSFNVRENKRFNKKPVYVTLNYKVTKIENV